MSGSNLIFYFHQAGYQVLKKKLNYKKRKFEYSYINTIRNILENTSIREYTSISTEILSQHGGDCEPFAEWL